MNRKILLAGLFACLSLPSMAVAQTQGGLAVKDATGATQTLCNVSSANGSVLVQCANIYEQGAQVSASNPLDVKLATLPNFTSPQAVTIATLPAISGTVSVSNFPSTQPLPTGAATSALQSSIVSALGAPFQAGGAIGNTSFGAKLQDASGAPFGTSGNPVFISGGGGSVPTGTAGSPNSQVLSIQGIAGGVAQPVTIASMPTTPVTGTFWQATQPVSGSVAVSNFPATQPVSGTLTANIGTAGTLATSALQTTANTSLAAIQAAVQAPTPAGTYNIGSVNVAALPPDTSATLTITAADTGSTTTTTGNANSQPLVTGTPTAGSAAVFSVAAAESVKYQVTGTFVGTLYAEQSIDGGVTYAQIGIHQAGTAYTSNGFTGSFVGSQNASGATQVRIRATSLASGTVTVLAVSTKNPNNVYVANGLSIQDPTIQSQRLAIDALGRATVVNAPSANNIGIVSSPQTASPITGQQTLSTTAAALPSNVLGNGLVITAPATNTATVYVGAAGVTTGTGYPLTAGQSISLSLSNSNGAFIIDTNSTDKVAFIGN